MAFSELLRGCIAVAVLTWLAKLVELVGSPSV